MTTDSKRKLIDWARKYSLGKRFSIGLVLATIVSVVVTYILLTNAPPLLRDTKLLIFFIYLDLVLLLSLGSLVSYRLVRLWGQHRSGRAGSKLHIRMVAIFSLLAIAPTIFIAVFSALFFQVGVQGWFNDRVEAAVGESLAVARAYMGEHQKVISANAQSMAIELYPYFQSAIPTPEQLNEKLTDQSALRSLTEAIVFNRDMDILGRSRFAFSMDFEAIQAHDLSRSADSVVIYTSEGNSRVRALVQIDPSQGIFLLVGRHISPEVLARVRNTEQVVSEYNLLYSESSHLAITFSILFIGVALMLLLAAIWGAIYFANKLADPVGQLIEGAEEVRRGNLGIRINESQESQELGSLIEAFNRMTAQLQSQRTDVINANSLLDQRRRFTEAILSGVSAGVIGMDKEGAINLPNQSASALLDTDLKEHIGDKLIDVLPETKELFRKLEGTEKGTAENEIQITRNGHTLTLLARLAADRFDGGITGYVLTFDDITELQSAQRQAAWADVARRIAHEIKNPLTPIQISAERLKRRYLPEVKDDPDTFRSCIDTIIRQVEHIGSMVNEFASFARMPAPKMESHNLIKICKNAIFLQKQAYPKIKFKFDSLTKKLPFLCDPNQIEQALTNLLKNAVEAVEAKGEGHKGIITVTLDQEPNRISIAIDDNGIGLPQEGRERLSEPYVTHREKGTGLGLAIVKRIAEDHQGNLNLAESDLGGAQVALVFSLFQNDNRRAS